VWDRSRCYRRIVGGSDLLHERLHKSLMQLVKILKAQDVFDPRHLEVYLQRRDELKVCRWTWLLVRLNHLLSKK